MSISLVLEVAISMVFLYLLGSQVVLSIYELWTGYLNKRGKFLYTNLKGTLGAETTQKLYAQPNISALTPAGQVPPTALTEGTRQWRLGKDGLPAYIPADLFSSTLLALIAPTASTNTDVKAALGLLPVMGSNAPAGNQPWLTQQAKDLLTQLLSGLPPTASLTDCQKAVAVWYDAYGERLTGWYKRRVRGWLALIGLLLAIFTNIDSLHIVRYLWLHPQVSHRIAEAASEKAKAPKDSAAAEALPPQQVTNLNELLIQKLRASVDSANALRGKLAGLGFPIGRTPTAPVDSATLPKAFYVYQPKQTVRLGRTIYSVDEHYLYYSLNDTPGSLADSIQTHSLAWTSRPVSLKDTIVKNIPDRTGVAGAEVPWLNPQPQPWWQTWAGWVLTALALSVGAPFWFDLLCRLVNIRNLGIKPPRTGRE